jgi:hypothetical protein
MPSRSKAGVVTQKGREGALHLLAATILAWDKANPGPAGTEGLDMFVTAPAWEKWLLLARKGLGHAN